MKCKNCGHEAVEEKSFHQDRKVIKITRWDKFRQISIHLWEYKGKRSTNAFIDFTEKELDDFIEFIKDAGRCTEPEPEVKA